MLKLFSVFLPITPGIREYIKRGGFKLCTHELEHTCIIKFAIYVVQCRTARCIPITATPKNMKICKYTYFFLACALSGYIIVIPFTSVTDRYKHKKCIIMETENKHENLHVCATCCYIFINPFTSCVTRYLPQQYIIPRPLCALPMVISV